MTNKPESWEERFDEKFTGERSGFGDYLERSSAKQIKSFITSEIEKAHEEGREIEKQEVINERFPLYKHEIRLSERNRIIEIVEGAKNDWTNVYARRALDAILQELRK